MDFTADPLTCFALVRTWELPPDLVAKIVARLRWEKLKQSTKLKQYILLYSIVEYWKYEFYDGWEMPLPH